MTELLLIFFIVLQGLDMYTTIIALKQGGRELNPLLAWLFKHFSPLSTMIVVKTIAVAALVWIDSFYANIISCAIYSWVVINNFGVIRK